jgi:uncharacterized protein YjbI with pentapeptide repeats
MNPKNSDLRDLKIEARVVGRVDVSTLRRLVFENEKVFREDFSGRKLDQFCALGSRFESCTFQRMQIEDASFGAGRQQSLYVDCSFDGSRMYNWGGRARFVRCSFRNVKLRESFCFNVELIDCIFTGQLKGVVFNGRPLPGQRGILGLKRNEFHGNDFSGAELVDVDFRTGIDLGKQVLPSGPDYLYLADAKSSLQRARREALDWPASEVRRVVLIWINSTLEDVERGQKQKIYRTKDCDLPGIGREETEAYLELLRKYA